MAKLSNHQKQVVGAAKNALNQNQTTTEVKRSKNDQTVFVVLEADTNRLDVPVDILDERLSNIKAGKNHTTFILDDHGITYKIKVSY